MDLRLQYYFKFIILNLDHLLNSSFKQIMASIIMLLIINFDFNLLII